MKEQFINNKIIGIIYKNLVNKLNLDLNTDAKTKLTKKMIRVMSDVYSNIDTSRVSESNLKNILRQFINNCYQIIYTDLNKDNTVKESFSQDNRMARDRQINPNTNNRLDPRSQNPKMVYDKDDRFASFDTSFNINPRQQNTVGFQGRYDRPSDPINRKSEFAGTLDTRYQKLQEEYKQSFNNGRPSTPPELKGDGGANLSRLSKENIKNKQNAYSNNNQNNNQNTNNNSRGSSNSASGIKSSISKDTFEFGTVTDIDNNYDTIDGSKIDFEGNMDVWNTGIDPKKFNIDEETPLSQRLSRFQEDRDNLDNSGPSQSAQSKKQVRFDGEKQQQLQQQQLREQQQEQLLEQRRQQQQLREQQQQKLREQQQQKLREQQNRDIQQREQRQPQQQQQFRKPQQQQQQQQLRKPQQQQQLREQPQISEQMLEFQERLQELQKQLMTINTKRDILMEQDEITPRIENKIMEYENMIGLLLEEIKDVQAQQIRYMSENQVNEDEDEDNGEQPNEGNEVNTKLRLLDEKKTEILGEVTKLQQLTLNLEKQQNLIKQKEMELENKMKKVSMMDNEKQVIIKSTNGRMTYSIDETLSNVKAIQLVGYDIPFDENNINNTNNKLYFSIISDKEVESDNDSDSSILSSDSMEYIEEVTINTNKVQMVTVPENNYDIYGLLDILNKIGKKKELNFSLVKGKIIIKTNRNNKLKLYMDSEYENNILPVLGFTRIIGDKYKHISDKKYDIRSDKLVQLFIKNVSNTPFAEFLIGSGKKHKIAKEIRIDKLNKLDIEIKLNDLSYESTEPYILEFNIIMDNSNKLEDIEEKDIDTDEDLLSKVSNLMNFASN